MPKIIDHDKYRMELAGRAAVLFSKHGYSGLGMRKIAAELGISKSALYHYFPTKQALFHACTDLVTRFDGAASLPPATGADALPTQVRIHQLMEAVKAMEPGFPQELSLLVDYLRGQTAAEIAADPTMALANQRYRDLVGSFVAGDDIDPVLCMALGVLLMRFLDGGATNIGTIERWLVAAVAD